VYKFSRGFIFASLKILHFASIYFHERPDGIKQSQMDLT